VLAVFLRGFLAVMAAEEILRGCGNAVGPALDEEGDVGFGVFSEELLDLGKEGWVRCVPLGC
jgi:hypothetical protein